MRDGATLTLSGRQTFELPVSSATQNDRAVCLLHEALS
jgi:hypothetical protein